MCLENWVRIVADITLVTILFFYADYSIYASHLCRQFQPPHEYHALPPKSFFNAFISLMLNTLSNIILQNSRSAGGPEYLKYLTPSSTAILKLIILDILAFAVFTIVCAELRYLVITAFTFSIHLLSVYLLSLFRR